MRIHKFGVILLVGFPFFGSPLVAQQPPNPAEAMQKMFEQFSQQANSFMPGMMGELSPEQKRRLERIEISKQEEDQAGKKAISVFLENAAKQKMKVVNSGRDVAYLQQLVKKIKPHMKNGDRYDSFQVRVIETDATDAYSFAGGHLLFTSGLLESIESEAALIGVVSHELSHLDRGHLLMGLKQAKLAQQPESMMDGMMMMAMFARPFRPEQESEADSDAVRWMMGEGYHPHELSRLLVQWDVKQSQQTPWMDFVPGFVKTHPDPGKRAQQVLELAKGYEKQFPNANIIGRDNLQKRQAHGRKPNKK